MAGELPALQFWIIPSSSLKLFQYTCIIYSLSVELAKDTNCNRKPHVSWIPLALTFSCSFFLLSLALFLHGFQCYSLRSHSNSSVYWIIHSFPGSTGGIYIFEFQNDHLEKLPGRLHATEQQITVTKPTKILELSPSHVVIVGQDREDGGETLVLNSTKADLICR